jgi:hypothetical protein
MLPIKQLDNHLPPQPKNFHVITSTKYSMEENSSWQADGSSASWESLCF